MLIDTHAHLTWESFKEDLDQVIDRAALTGVQTIINIGADIESSKKALRLAQGKQSKIKFYSTIGLHHEESSNLTTAESIHQNVGELEGIYKNYPGKIVAVGECGLDYFEELGRFGGFGELEEMKKAQMGLFQAQIELAKKLNLPLIVHCRDAWQDIPWDDLKGIPVVFHYFTGSLKDAQKIIEMGFYLSFSCIVTYPKNEALREIIKFTPLDKILTETDSPFSPPQNKRGRRNEPTNVIEVVKTIAQVKDLSFEQVAQTIFQNAQKLFNLV